MARAALEWSLEDAAAAAGGSRRTVLRFERYHRDVRPELIEALRRAYEAAGEWFVDEGPRANGERPVACVVNRSWDRGSIRMAEAVRSPH
jgi:transcriptional regulator with XRE-family HTH domain